MAGATSETLESKMSFPLRSRCAASEPTLCLQHLSGSPPLLVSSDMLPCYRSLPFQILVRCNWVGHEHGALVAPPAADVQSGALPHLERVGGYHLHLRHHWPIDLRD